MLRDELNRANILVSDEISPDCVTMNSAVELVDDEADKTYQMTGAPNSSSRLGQQKVICQ